MGARAVSRCYRWQIEHRPEGEEDWTVLAETHRNVGPAIIHATDFVRDCGGTCRIWDSRERKFTGEVGADLLWHPVDNFAIRAEASPMGDER